MYQQGNEINNISTATIEQNKVDGWIDLIIIFGGR